MTFGGTQRSNTIAENMQPYVGLACISKLVLLLSLGFLGLV